MIKQNWAGNYTYTAARIHYPETIAQVQALVKQASKLKVLGSGHSFNDIADTPGDMISLDRFNTELVIDRDRQTVTVGAGVKYGQICEQLYREGYALHNLASLPHISVAGACATGTHGSGYHNGNLATAVAAMELVTPAGDVVLLSREQDGQQFSGAVVGLGGLGVVTKLTLDIVPRFDMRQYVYEKLPLTQLVEHFDDIMSRAYSVSLFTDWRSEQINQVWVKQRVETDHTPEVQPELFGATLATTQRHPIPGMSGEACTPQLGVPGPWYERLPHFRMDFTPSSGEELQTEYLLPHEQAVAALQEIASIREQVFPLLQISEVRTIAADNLWLSPCYQQARVGLHFTWVKDWEKVRQLLPMIEERLAPLGAVPHWGKVFTMSALQVQSLYAKLADFQQLQRAFDPQGKFRNAFLDRYIFGVD